MSYQPKHKIYSLGDSALTFEFGREITEELNAKAIALSRHIERTPFDGLVECVPAYSSVTIYYDIKRIATAGRNDRSAYLNVKRHVEIAASELNSVEETESGLFEIPVSFSKRNGPDLAFVAKHNKLTEDEVIEIFSGRTYRVFMLGFLPGFPYMGRVDERITAPRRDSPRKSVPKGSVGIAGVQTGIYPSQSPGGWRIIGKTKTELFSGTEERPTLLSPGDRVTFVRI